MTDSTKKDDDPVFAAKLKKYRERSAAYEAEIKTAILTGSRRAIMSLTTYPSRAPCSTSPSIGTSLCTRRTF
jgi:hypothetical protein